MLDEGGLFARKREKVEGKERKGNERKGKQLMQHVAASRITWLSFSREQLDLNLNKIEKAFSNMLPLVQVSRNNNGRGDEKSFIVILYRPRQFSFK